MGEGVEAHLTASVHVVAVGEATGAAAEQRITEPKNWEIADIERNVRGKALLLLAVLVVALLLRPLQHFLPQDLLHIVGRKHVGKGGGRVLVGAH